VPSGAPPAAQPASENVNAETIDQIFGEFFMPRLPLVKQRSMPNETSAGIAARAEAICAASAATQHSWLRAVKRYIKIDHTTNQCGELSDG
jgi:hypothetical protein